MADKTKTTDAAAGSAPQAATAAELLAAWRGCPPTWVEEMEAASEALGISPGEMARLPGQALPVEPPAAGSWLTAEQAARHVGLSLRAFYSAVERGQVPASRLGRRLRFHRSGLDRLLLRKASHDDQLIARVPSSASRKRGGRRW